MEELNHGKILVVDDSDLERELLIEVLKGAGVQNNFLQARTGEEAIEILGTHYKEVGLILLDWQMPRMSGMEFMEAVVKVPQVANKPIIMVTASGTDENKKKAWAVNPNLVGYVVKPYTPESLLDVIYPFVQLKTTG
ncbi:MAG TPA: response regulator [Candidatus Omnitrophota bacterium]|nr:response regulator [Candidatus Omnitrophota bacterium]HPB67747.1 response regulator [Candidatus Omnitrophota bacterium]HQO58144.1 response regulator [Candidatus Omnitrophota bacterium]HQP11708.1 response regulator [Candidatus Omnitrophota bacterium]